MGQVSDDITRGQCCAECGTYFEKPNGYPVLCNSCYAEEGPTRAKESGYQKTRTREL